MDPLTEAEQAYHDLVLYQAWTPATQAQLLLDFIRDRGLVIDLVNYCETRACVT